MALRRCIRMRLSLKMRWTGMHPEPPPSRAAEGFERVD